MMYLKHALLAGTIAFFALFPFQNNVHAGTAKASKVTEAECLTALEIALFAFVKEGGAFPNRRAAFRLQAYNDLMCTDAEWMMNIAISVYEVEKDEYWYGVFHIHFLPNGTFKSAAPFNTPAWQRQATAVSEEWKVSWCENIRTVYPDDFAKMCAPTPAASPESSSPPAHKH